ncbi:recombinase family protein [Streptococcus dysgalactiae]|uniref:recombinase family protein n=2 Tax=Streptococcus dysgalactiae TaxID=1334 RepID=UPI00232B32F2|nr:recombinase family protein [Streptococcus dysgalactiae]WCE85766.1 recombinase family protein [Streptococcus dysgalactiae]WCN25764.1 recombinase family protein [Streptococcus dysgalactiae]
MADVKVIKASSGRIDRRNAKVIDRLRVGAYCRVSTDSEEQLNSYNSQVEHYRNMVEANPQWSLVDIYADEGISGTKTDKRAEFQRMINDAVDGKIDLIITKSISRFARNTLDTLKYVRLLKDYNVAILFEKENINTLTMNGEMLLTILSSLAQQESESISTNVKMGLKMKMKRGELIGFNGCLGYDYDTVNKVITVNKEEAKIVRYIFKRYIEGVGCFVIAKELTQLKYKTKKGNTNWNDSSVRRIITNEKYKGDLLLGKTFTVDPISKRRLDNMGEEEKYYISSNHEPIISEEVFNEAQKILEKRSAKSNNKGRGEKYSRKFAFSSKIECGFCGGIATRRRWHSSTTHEKTIWHCCVSTKKGKKYCPDSKGINEKIIENAFIEAFNMFCLQNKDIVTEFMETVENTLNNTNTAKELKRVEKEIISYENKLKKLVDMRIDEIIDKATYEIKFTELSTALEKLKAEKVDLDASNENNIDIKKRINSFRKVFDSNKPIKEFDRIVFESAVNKIILGGTDEDGNKDPYMITFIFNSGMSHSLKGKHVLELDVNKNDEEVCSYRECDTGGFRY